MGDQRYEISSNYLNETLPNTQKNFRFLLRGKLDIMMLLLRIKMPMIVSNGILLIIQRTGKKIGLFQKS